MGMSAILERSAPVSRTAEPLYIAELEPESVFAENPKLRFDPAAELERLRPLLTTYDPKDDAVPCEPPPRDYGLLIVKFVGYTILGAITAAVGLSILAGFAVGGC